MKIISIVITFAITQANSCEPPTVCAPQYQYQKQYQPQPQLQIQPPVQSIPQYNSFNSPTPSSQTLNCVFSTNIITSTYDCISTNTTIKSNGISFNSLEGSHTSNHTNYDVDGLKISSQTCHFMPSELSEIIPKLKKLEITNSGLLEIDELDTRGLIDLKYLNLKGNRITRLGFRLFRFNIELVSIDFSDNFIKIVADDLLVPFDHMQYIDFSNNLCVKNQQATDNFREWDRELRRNCDPVEKFHSVPEPLWRITENANSNGFKG